MNMHLIEATEENAVKNLQRYIKQLSFFYPLLIKDIIITTPFADLGLMKRNNEYRIVILKHE